MEQKIISILSEIKEDKSLIHKVGSDTKIIDDIGLDSLEMINFVLRIEEEFNVEIDFEVFDFSNMETISSICKFIEKSLETA